MNAEPDVRSEGDYHDFTDTHLEITVTGNMSLKVHTNTIEVILVRTLNAAVLDTFHRVSAKYVPLYVAEFQFRYNNTARKRCDILRRGESTLLRR